MFTTKLLYIFALGFLFVIYSFSDKDALRSKGALRDKASCAYSQFENFSNSVFLFVFYELTVCL